MQDRKKVAISWSGGKDCCLALSRVLKENYDVVCLISMISRKDGRNHAHGLPLEVLKIQANALGIPLVLVDSADDYEKSLVVAFQNQKARFGVEVIVFGSLYAQEDREWNEKVAMKAGLESLFPVWTTKELSKELFHEFLALGFRAIICRASKKYFEKSDVGRLLDVKFYKDVLKKRICVMGEMGEYHTIVVDGPLFHQKVGIIESEVILNHGLWSLDIQKCI